jgi:hypothetical protein
MMKTTAILVVTFLFFSIFFFCEMSQAETKGDLNGDGRIGLEDTIISLQIVSGVRPPNTKEIVTSEYFDEEDEEYSKIVIINEEEQRNIFFENKDGRVLIYEYPCNSQNPYYCGPDIKILDTFTLDKYTKDGASGVILKLDPKREWKPTKEARVVFHKNGQVIEDILLDQVAGRGDFFPSVKKLPSKNLILVISYKNCGSVYCNFTDWLITKVYDMQKNAFVEEQSLFIQ